MTVRSEASQDFDRAVAKGFWRRVIKRLKGETNELLPFNEVRERFPLQGQHYVGLRTIPINYIVGSVGRYNDFDRAFLPIQKHTKNRWVHVDEARYENIELPPIELYKVGEVYFVKDGNHRVSVARESGQEFIDAYVVEIIIPVDLTLNTSIDELELKQAYSDFLTKTSLKEIFDDANLELKTGNYYYRLLQHIDDYMWHLRKISNREVKYQEAVAFWYEKVYIPVINEIRNSKLLPEYKNLSETDIYLWVMDYFSFLKHAYQDDYTKLDPTDEAINQLEKTYSNQFLRRLSAVIQSNERLTKLALELERARFFEYTKIDIIYPDANIQPSIPGQYDRLRKHIEVHRWYLGEESEAPVSLENAVISWYDNVYLPVVEIIREQQILKKFPGRTETDLYIWIITHKWYLNQRYGGNVSDEQAVDDFTKDFGDE